MAKRNGLSASKMASRILDREDNKYKREIVYSILQMYMDECRKALIRGERVQISGVGTIIPEVKTHIGNFNLPVCNREGGNPPYTRIRMSRNNSLGEKMNVTLRENIENGVLGLEKLPFDKRQITILKDSGYISVDEEYEEEEEY